MPFTGDSLTITAEENSSKRLLVLHKSETGLKIGRQTGESSDAFMSAAAVHSGRQRRPQAVFEGFLYKILRLTPVFGLVYKITLLFSGFAYLSKK